MRNINDEIWEKLEIFQNGGDNFEDILELCKPLLKTALKKVEYTSPITYDELYNEATVGLWEICKKYKKREGAVIYFSRYLVTNIIYYLINYIRDTQTNIRIPAHEYRKKVAAEKNGNEYSKINNIINMKRETEEFDPFGELGFDEKYSFEDEFEDERLINGFKVMTDEEKEIVKMYIVDGYNFKEIGQIKNIGKNKVSKLYKSGVQKIQLS